MTCYTFSPPDPFPYRDIFGNPIDMQREVEFGDLYRKTEVEEIEVDELLDKDKNGRETSKRRDDI